MHAPLNKNKDLSNVYKIILATGLWHRFSSIHVNLELNWCKTRRLTDPNPSSLRAIEQGLTGPLSPYTDWVSPSWKMGHGDSKGAPHLWIPIWPALARSPRHPDHSRNHTVCVCDCEGRPPKRCLPSSFKSTYDPRKTSARRLSGPGMLTETAWRVRLLPCPPHSSVRK